MRWGVGGSARPPESGAQNARTCIAPTAEYYDVGHDRRGRRVRVASRTFYRFSTASAARRLRVCARQQLQAPPLTSPPPPPRGAYVVFITVVRDGDNDTVTAARRPSTATRFSPPRNDVVCVRVPHNGSCAAGRVLRAARRTAGCVRLRAVHWG